MQAELSIVSNLDANPGTSANPRKKHKTVPDLPTLTQGHDSGLSHSPQSARCSLGVAVFVELYKLKRNKPTPAPPTRARGGGRGYASDGRPKMKRSC